MVFAKTTLVNRAANPCNISIANKHTQKHNSKNNHLENQSVFGKQQTIPRTESWNSMAASNVENLKSNFNTLFLYKKNFIRTLRLKLLQE